MDVVNFWAYRENVHYPRVLGEHMDANEAFCSARPEHLVRVLLLRILLFPAAVIAIYLLGVVGAEADQGGGQLAPSDEAAVDQGSSETDAEPAPAEEPAAEPAPAKEPESQPQDQPEAADEESAPSPSDETSEPASEPARDDDESGESPSVQGETQSEGIVAPTLENADTLAADKPIRTTKAVTRTVVAAGSALASDGTLDDRARQTAGGVATPLAEETARTLDDVRTFTQREVRIVTDGARGLTSTLLDEPVSTPDDAPVSSGPKPVRVVLDRAAAVLPTRLEQATGIADSSSTAAGHYASATPVSPDHVTDADAGHEPLGSAPTAPTGDASVATGSGGASASTVATGAEAALVAAAGTPTLPTLDDWLPRSVSRHPGFSPD